MDTVSDFTISTTALAFGYLFSYFFGSALLELTNPAPKDAKRMANIKKEVKLGIVALLSNTFYAGLWLWLVDKHTPFFGYWERHEFTAVSLIVNVLVYMFWMDSWFYWTHRLLHRPWWWKNIHYVHHQFLHPTAFAQDAVHPFEAVFQGPMGHHFTSLVYPMHPVVMAVCGFLTSIYANAAHDGRSLDLNDHCKHHTHKHVNFGLYWGVWDFICGTRYDPKKTAAWKGAVLELNEEDKMK